MASKVQHAVDYWTVARENLGTRWCYKTKSSFSPLRVRNYFKWIRKHLLNSALVGYGELCRSCCVDNTLLDLQNSSYLTQPHSIILLVIVFTVFHIFSITGKIWKLGSITQIFHSFSWRIFQSHDMSRPMACMQGKFWQIITGCGLTYPDVCNKDDDDDDDKSYSRELTILIWFHIWHIIDSVKMYFIFNKQQYRFDPMNGQFKFTFRILQWFLFPRMMLVLKIYFVTKVTVNYRVQKAGQRSVPFNNIKSYSFLKFSQAHWAKK